MIISMKHEATPLSVSQNLWIRLLYQVGLESKMGRNPWPTLISGVQGHVNTPLPFFIWGQCPFQHFLSLSLPFENRLVLRHREEKMCPLPSRGSLWLQHAQTVRASRLPVTYFSSWLKHQPTYHTSSWCNKYRLYSLSSLPRELIHSSFLEFLKLRS